MNRKPNPTRETAFRIALRFRDHIPTAKEIQAAFPLLTRATAYRYAKDFSRACKQAA